MIELLKLPCEEKGCRCSAGRVVDDGSGPVLEVFTRKHHGARHDPRIDLRSLYAKLNRVRREIIEPEGARL